MVVRELITLLGFKVEDSKLKAYENGIKKVTKTAAIAGGAVLGLGGFFIKLSGDMEQTQMAFEVMLGSAEAAKKMVDDINTMGAKTPYEASDLLNNAKLLLTFGAAAEDIIPTLQMLGDVGAGDAQRLQSITRAFGKISASGRLTGEDLNMLIDAGFDPLREMAGKSTEEYQRLRKEMEKGNISAKMVTDTFKKVTSEGGRFFHMMEKQSGTFLGMWSTAVDMVKMLAIEIGNELLPFGKDLLFEFSKWFDANKDFMKAGFVAVFKSIAMAIGYIIVAIEEVGAIFGGWKNIFEFLGMALTILFKIMGTVIRITWKFIKIILKALVAVLKILGSVIKAFINFGFAVVAVTRKIWSAINSVYNIIKSVITAIIDFGKYIFDSITNVDLITRAWENVINTIKDAIAWAGKFLGMGSGEEKRAAAAAQMEAQKNIPKYKTGSAFVPKDGLAYLHRGESVLTADKTARTSQNNSSQNINIQTTVHAPMPPGSTEAQAAYIKQVAKQTITSEWQSILRQAKAATPPAGAH